MDRSSDLSPPLLTRTGQCARHGEFTERAIEIAMRPPVGPRTIWLGCPSCAQQAQQRSLEEATALQERQRQHRVERKLGLGGVPARYRGLTFDRFEATTPEQQYALRCTQRFATQLLGAQRRRATLVLSGDTGTGKTMLALAIMQHVQPAMSALYLKALDLIRSVRGAWRKNAAMSEDDVVRLLAETGLLIIDEVGVQYGTEAEQDVMFDVLDRRYQDLRPTILVTNEDKKNLRIVLGDRSFDRLRQDGVWVACEWPSYRGAGRPDEA